MRAEKLCLYTLGGGYGKWWKLSLACPAVVVGLLGMPSSSGRPTAVVVCTHHLKIGGTRGAGGCALVGAVAELGARRAVRERHAARGVAEGACGTKSTRLARHVLARGALGDALGDGAVAIEARGAVLADFVHALLEVLLSSLAAAADASCEAGAPLDSRSTSARTRLAIRNTRGVLNGPGPRRTACAGL